MNTHQAIWTDRQPRRLYPRIDRDVEVDVAIVGAGITGITAALLLRKAGASVALLDRHHLGDGETRASSAHLSALLDDRYSALQRELSDDDLRLVARAARRSIDAIEDLVQGLEIDCDFRRCTGYLFSERVSDAESLRAEAALLERLGFVAAVHDGAPLPFATGSAVSVANEALIHPRKYVLALAKRAHAAGVLIFEQSEVASFADGQPCILETSPGPTDPVCTVRARDVIFAAHAPLTRMAIQSKLAHFTSYVAAFPARGVVQEGLFCDTSEPYHYLCTAEVDGQPYWIVGGQDHRTGLERDTTQRYAALRRYIRERFAVAESEIEFSWSGQVLESADGLPLVGLIPGASHLYTATGFGGNGLTWGTLSAEILRDRVMGRKNPYADLFEARRLVPVGALDSFFADAASVMRCYLGDLVTLASTDGVGIVPRGHGRVVRRDGTLVAAHRDAQGRLHVVSPRCPHMGGLVHFNTAEQTWDCPCHGSRFAIDGSVICGPAMSPLAPLPEPWSRDAEPTRHPAPPATVHHAR